MQAAACTAWAATALGSDRLAVPAPWLIGPLLVAIAASAGALVELRVPPVLFVAVSRLLLPDGRSTAVLVVLCGASTALLVATVHVDVLNPAHLRRHPQRGRRWQSSSRGPHRRGGDSAPRERAAMDEKA